MGTGSGGGGGSGSGGGGVGGGSATSGGYRFEKDKDGRKRIVGITVEEKTVQASIHRKLRKIPTTYLKKQFGSPLARHIFKELCTFSEWIDMESPCTNLADEYRIEDGPGFLVQWVGALMTMFQHEELNSKMRATARMAAEDFLIRALNDDLDLYVLGACADVLPKLDRRIFARTSRYFLGNMIWRVIEREYERQPRNVQQQMQEECLELAKEIVEVFEERFVKEGKATDCDLFDVIEQQMDWFVQALREKPGRE